MHFSVDRWMFTLDSRIQRKVETKYFASAFLGHARATDLLEKFKSVFNKEQFIRIDSGVDGWSFCQLEIY